MREPKVGALAVGLRKLVTLETYGHLIDGDLGAALDLTEELAEAERPDASAPQAAWSGS